MKKLGELLVEQGKISERDVERALLAQSEMGDLFGQVLVKLGLVSEQDVALVLVLRTVCTFRVDRDMELEGLDINQHGEQAYSL